MDIGFQRVTQMFVGTVKLERGLYHAFTPIGSVLIPVVLV